MEFLSEIGEYKKVENTRKMEAWAEKYPFAAMVLFGKLTEEELVQEAEYRFGGKV